MIKLEESDFIKLGGCPYHYAQNGDYVFREGTGEFDKFTGPQTQVDLFPYAIYRLDTDKLLARIEKLEESLLSHIK